MVQLGPVRSGRSDPSQTTFGDLPAQLRVADALYPCSVLQLGMLGAVITIHTSELTQGAAVELHIRHCVVPAFVSRADPMNLGLTFDTREPSVAQAVEHLLDELMSELQSALT